MTTKTLLIQFGSFNSGARVIVPFRAFESAVQDIKRFYPAELEQKTCMVDVTIHGCTIEHTLTLGEEIVALREQLEAAQARIRELENPDEHGSGIAGTPAEQIGHTWGPSDVAAAAPEDRPQVFLNWFTQSGWKLPDHDAAVWLGVLQQGVTHAEAEKWLRLTPGYFTKVGHERGLKAP